MLVPALLARTLYEVLRRRIFKYPTASELRSRLLAAERADAVADALTIELDTHTDSGFGLRYAMLATLIFMHVHISLGMSGEFAES